MAILFIYISKNDLYNYINIYIFQFYSKIVIPQLLSVL